MATKKLVQILRSKGAPFTPDEMNQISDKEAWAWVYKNFPPKKKRSQDLSSIHKPKICFTGFTQEEKLELITISGSLFKVCNNVVVGLDILVTGQAPGSRKLEDAARQNAKIIDRNEFMKILKKHP